MDFLDQMTLYPSSEHIVLLKVIISLMLIIHIPYISILLGGSMFSLIFSISDKREPNANHIKFSKDLIHLITSNNSAPVLLGVLPLISLILTFAQLYQGSDFKITSYLFIVLFLSIAGFILIYVFKSSFHFRDRFFPLHVILGVCAVGAFMIAYLIFSATTALMFFPEKWKFVYTAFPIFIYANELPRAALFLFFTLALTGAAILYFFLSWPGRKEIQTEYGNFIRKFGAAVGLIFVLLIPVFVVWHLITFPDVAASASVFAVWGVVLLLLLIAAILFNSALKTHNRKLVTFIFMLFLVISGVMTVNDRIAAGNANHEHEVMLAAKAEEIHQEILAVREAKSSATTQINGEEIFTNICTACHQFDQRVVGPPYMSVMSKYVNDKDALVQFIMNPVKKDPDYPPMPSQNLKEPEASAVADYLLQEYASRK